MCSVACASPAWTAATARTEPALPLSPAHLEELRGSGLSDTTIANAGIYSSPPGPLRELLNWHYPTVTWGGGVVYPYRDVQGRPVNLFRVKPDKPPRDKRGKTAKYLQPVGRAVEPYFTGPLEGIEIDGRTTVLFTEGEKKSLFLRQIGFAVIGLSGVYGWMKKRDKDAQGNKLGERRLLPALQPLDWTRYHVAVLFDRDPRRNPMVEQAGVELLLALERAGAKALGGVLSPPIIPDEHGNIRKLGVDDFGCLVGEDKAREWIIEQFTPQARISLQTYREHALTARLAIVHSPGVYLDCGPAGCGKTHRDIQAIRQVEASVTACLSHAACEEFVGEMERHGVHGVAYPKLDEETCANFLEAQQALEAGMRVSSTACVGCAFHDKCDYRLGVKVAERASHSVATLRRLCLSFATLTQGRDYVAVTESPLDAFLDQAGATDPAGFDKLASVADGIAVRWDRQGGETTRFAEFLAELARVFGDMLRTKTRMERLDYRDFGFPPRPSGFEKTLFEEMKRQKVFPPAACTRIALGVLSGDVATCTLIVEPVVDKESKVVTGHKRSILATWENKPPEGACTVLSDATARLSELERVIGKKITDITQIGRLGHAREVYQIPWDLRKGSATRTVLGVLRGILARFPAWRRIGLICDRAHLPAIRGTARRGETLEPWLRERIIETDYFRGARSRGVNSWKKHCDGMIILGTPRVPPSAVRNRLAVTGQETAAGIDLGDEWTAHYFAARTTTGALRAVKTKSYRDWRWFGVHETLVRGELIQCLGRARTVCEDGVPTVVVTCEPLDLSIIDGVDSISQELLARMRGAFELWPPISIGACREAHGHQSLISTLIENGGHSSEIEKTTKTILTSEWMGITGVSRTQAKDDLTTAERLGLVERIGQRGGWRCTDKAGEFFASKDSLDGEPSVCESSDPPSEDSSTQTPDP